MVQHTNADQRISVSTPEGILSVKEKKNDVKLPHPKSLCQKNVPVYKYKLWNKCKKCNGNFFLNTTQQLQL